MVLIGLILYWAIGCYLLILLARAFLSFLPLFRPNWQPNGIAVVMLELIYTVTDPPLKFLGKYLPPLRLGGFYLDVSFILFYFVLIWLQRIIIWVIQ